MLEDNSSIYVVKISFLFSYCFDLQAFLSFLFPYFLIFNFSYPFDLWYYRLLISSSILIPIPFLKLKIFIFNLVTIIEMTNFNYCIVDALPGNNVFDLCLPQIPHLLGKAISQIPSLYKLQYDYFC